MNRIVEQGWLAVADSAKTDISPCYDNRPYIAQMGLWRNLDANKLEKVIAYSDIFGFPLSKMIIVIILMIVIGLIIPLNLLPYLLKGEKLKGVPWLYFFTIGMAFMIVEIILIQKYALFIGSSVYSISTVLLTLLLASGLGSRLSQKLPGGLVFVMITFWLLLDIFVFNNIANGLIHLSLVPRMLMTTAFIFPLGFFMGMPFPKAAVRVGALVDWGFAVNGAAAVLGSAAIMLIVFAFGFQIALLVATVLYLLAWFLFTRKSSWS
ncbi:MAG: hypothetical protein E4H13_09140 [Calditrichales bacterium]|nr:MAG: hypothetical protein E4H13_09140 [Calditrichales bacterium]